MTPRSAFADAVKHLLEQKPGMAVVIGHDPKFYSTHANNGHMTVASSTARLLTPHFADDGARFAFLSALVERSILSTKDLTVAEAVILSTMIRTQPDQFEALKELYRVREI